MKNKIVISSSMRFKDLIKSTIKKLNDLGYEAVFPNIDSNPEATLTLENKKKLIWDHYYAIDEADAIYFILPNGYMGTSCKIELGYALAKEIPIYFSELTNDIGLDGNIKKVISLDNLVEFNNEFTQS